MTFVFDLQPSDFVLCAFFSGTTNVEQRLKAVENAIAGLGKDVKRLNPTVVGLEKDVKHLKVQNPVGSCKELSTIGLNETKKYPITVNGMSFEATCDMTSKMTTFEPTSKEIAILETPVPTDREYDIQYEATTSQIDSVIQSSPACSQSLTFHCSNEATSWKNPYNHKTLLVIKRKDGSYIKPQDTSNYNGRIFEFQALPFQTSIKFLYVLCNL